MSLAWPITSSLRELGAESWSIRWPESAKGIKVPTMLAVAWFLSKFTYDEPIFLLQNCQWGDCKGFWSLSLATGASRNPRSFKNFFLNKPRSLDSELKNIKRRTQTAPSTVFCDSAIHTSLAALAPWSRARQFFSTHQLPLLMMNVLLSTGVCSTGDTTSLTLDKHYFGLMLRVVSYDRCWTRTIRPCVHNFGLIFSSDFLRCWCASVMDSLSLQMAQAAMAHARTPKQEMIARLQLQQAKARQIAERSVRLA